MSTVAPNTLSKHRIEALTDGIYAVAMTLLVISLDLPSGANVTNASQLLDVLAKQVGVRGVFSDWPATTTYYASCIGMK